MWWDLFNPKDGSTQMCVPWEWLARFLTRIIPSWDYAEEGTGWPPMSEYD